MKAKKLFLNKNSNKIIVIVILLIVAVFLIIYFSLSSSIDEKLNQVNKKSIDGKSNETEEDVDLSEVLKSLTAPDEPAATSPEDLESLSIPEEEGPGGGQGASLEKVLKSLTPSFD